MKIKYIPNSGFQIGSEKFSWNEDRESIRKKIQNQHISDDRIIQMAEFTAGDKSHEIKQRRDIYEDINNEENYFFLSYDKEGHLSELEIHEGIEISVKEIKLIFEKDISKYLKELHQIGENYSEIEAGNYFFENLKMTIANAEAMGGEGKGLEYFYSAKNIEHLIEK